MSSESQSQPKMQYRFLGRSGLQVSALSLGGWLTYGGSSENDNTFKCMEAAYKCGMNFFDCAEGYAGGDSERIMGECIKKYGWKRNDIVISTKINWGAANGTNPVNNVGLSRKHIVEGVKASLERLQLDYVDLIYAHRPDRNTPLEETVRAFNYIIDQGMAFYWGTSEWDASEIAAAKGIADRLGLIGPLMEQPQYNLFDRKKVEREYAQLYDEVGLGLTVFSPLKTGILTGKYNHGVPKDSRFGAKSNDAWLKSMEEKIGNADWQKDIEKVKNLLPIAKKLNCTQAAMGLAWVLKNPRVSSAITGASRPSQVYDSLQCLEVIDKLTPEIMKEIDDVMGNKPEELTMRFY